MTYSKLKKVGTTRHSGQYSTFVARAAIVAYQKLYIFRVLGFVAQESRVG
jgi:hypothetical protein